jgi:hypothetical protein
MKMNELGPRKTRETSKTTSSVTVWPPPISHQHLAVTTARGSPGLQPTVTLTTIPATARSKKADDRHSLPQKSSNTTVSVAAYTFPAFKGRTTISSAAPSASKVPDDVPKGVKSAGEVFQTHI